MILYRIETNSIFPIKDEAYLLLFRETCLLYCLCAMDKPLQCLHISFRAVCAFNHDARLIKAGQFKDYIATVEDCVEDTIFLAGYPCDILIGYYLRTTYRTAFLRHKIRLTKLKSLAGFPKICDCDDQHNDDYYRRRGTTHNHRDDLDRIHIDVERF